MVTVVEAPGQGHLMNVGPVFPVIITGPSGSVSTMALVDTGATTTSIDEDILKRVGARQIGAMTIDGATGRAQVPVYTARISTTDGQVLLDGQAQTLGTQLPESCQVLIGRDILSGFQFSYNGGSGHWSFGTTGTNCGCHTPIWTTAAAITIGHLSTIGVTALLGAMVRAALHKK